MMYVNTYRFLNKVVVGTCQKCFIFMSVAELTENDCLVFIFEQIYKFQYLTLKRNTEHLKDIHNS